MVTQWESTALTSFRHENFLVVTMDQFLEGIYNTTPQ